MNQKEKKRKVGDTSSRQSIGQNQILRNFISWKNGTFKLLWLSLEKNPTLSFQEAVMMGDDRTHTTIPLRTVTAALTGISWPFSCFAFVTVNTERTDEVTMKIVASTK
jgi:hypothetical protein